MKNYLPVLLSFTLSVLFTQKSQAQLIVNSTEGYNVTVNIKATEIIPNGIQQSGYNYNVKLSYSISFSGNLSAAHLWTMQGTLGCGSTNTHWFDLPESQTNGTTISNSNQWATGSPVGATPATLSCQNINITISGNGISSRTVSVPANAVLPVQMASFTVSFDFNKVRLDWSTASEENNAYFTIERSADGTTFSPLSKIKGAGNSTSLVSYHYTDETPANGTSYYRIRQTDFDGRSTVSEVRMIKNNNSAKTISLYPLPNNGNTINFSGIRDYKNYNLTVISATGASLFQSTLSSSSVTLPLLQTGFYFVRITDKISGEVTNIRYIKN